MAVLDLYQYAEMEVNGVKLRLGSRANPEEITVDGYVKDSTKSLLTATTWDVWITGAEEPLTNFDFLWVESDKAVFLELVVDTDNSVGREDIAIQIQAGVPFCLASDDAMALHTVDFAGTETEDVIDAVRVRNVSGSTAIVRVVLVT